MIKLSKLCLTDHYNAYLTQHSPEKVCYNKKAGCGKVSENRKCLKETGPFLKIQFRIHFKLTGR